ncbi:MAG: MFS transporter [Candidatus Hydrogenedentota bacterium]
MMKHKLLIASFLTIMVNGIGTAVRGGILVDWGTDFRFTQTELGEILGMGFTGFGCVILLASLFLDRFGYKPFLVLAGVLHTVSVFLTVAATYVYASKVDADPEAAKAAAYFCLKWGIFIFAVANGICEAVINPLIATIYSKEKTHYLNILHAGWPAGMIVGSLMGLVMIGNVRWEIILALYLIPTLMYLFMIAKEEFPKSEAAEAGVSFMDMVKEFAAPILLLLLFLHALIGFVELGTDGWIANIMNTALSGKGLLILLYTSTLMFVLRFFAGPIVHRTNPMGLLFISACLATVGLYALGSFASVAMIMISATVYACGKTFFWPTMLAVVSERFPRGGALTLGAIGAAGMLSAGILGGPGIGYMQDRYASSYLEEQAPALYEEYSAEGTNSFLVFAEVKGLDGSKVGPLLGKAQSEPETLTEDEKTVVESSVHGGQMALKTTAAVPLTLAVGYLLLLLYFRSQGGYTAVEIGSKDEETPPATE